ncbi:MAG: GAF domain-containing protein [Candidatus Schekmanbacteria bacterium]|nr:MAG: GAF domain-containing protein [Candidatus Schekmanbacteria bacterium]
MGKMKFFFSSIFKKTDSLSEGMAEHERDYFYNAHTTMLLEIGKAMKSSFTDPDQTMNLITSSVTLILNTERSLLFLNDKNTNQLNIASASGIINPDILKNISINFGEGFIGKIAESKEPRMEHNKVKIAENFEVSEIIGAPIIYQDELFGVLTADSKRAGKKFNENDLKLLSILANLAAIDIESSNIHKAMKQRNERLTALCDISRAMTSTLELQKLLDLIVDKALALTNATSSSIMLIDEETQILNIMAFRGLQEGTSERVKLKVGEGITGTVAKTGKPILENNVRKNPHYVEVAKEISSELAVPMFYEGKIMGVINVDSIHLNAFTEEDLELMTTLSNHASVAINNAKLFEKMSK